MIHVQATFLNRQGNVAHLIEAYPPWNVPLRTVQVKGVEYQLESSRNDGGRSWSCLYREMEAGR